MNILLTIAARGGSKGVKNKNIRELCGKPLLAYTVEQALAWKKAKDVIVTTDSKDIAAVAEKYGAQVPFLRPADLATDQAPKVPALRHALLEIEKLKKLKYDLIVDLDPTAPVRTLKDLDAALKLFLEKKPKVLLSAVISHKNPYFNMLEPNATGFASISKKGGEVFARRQDAPPVYSANASIYIYNREFLADPTTNSVMSDRTLIYPMDDLSSIDVDREIDFQFLEYLAKEKIWNPEKL